MSVVTLYQGRFGNNVFQYAAARLFAMERGLKLETEFPGQEILPTTPNENGKFYDGPHIGIGDGDDIFNLPERKGRHVFRGFFQRAEWYFKRRKMLEKIFKPKPVLVENKTDLLMSVRLGDYFYHKIAIHPSWYIKILEKESFSRLVIVTDDPNPDYFKHFAPWNPIIVPNNVVEHWNVIRSCEKVIAANSTYCWWALFFGKAKKIYIFKRWVDNPISNLQEFEGAIQVDGPFLHEVS